MPRSNQPRTLPDHNNPIAARLLYSVPEAMELLHLGRTGIYEEIRSGRLRSIKRGRSRLISATAITDYITQLENTYTRTAA